MYFSAVREEKREKMWNSHEGKMEKISSSENEYERKWENEKMIWKFPQPKQLQCMVN